MIFHLTSSGATHTLPFLSPLTLSVRFSFLPLPAPTNAQTPTQRRAQVLTSHLQQICWSLCTHIKLMTSLRQISPETERSCRHLLPPLQYSSAKKEDEGSMIYQCHCAFSPWLIHKHNARWQKKGNSSSTCGVMLQHSMDLSKCEQSPLNTDTSFSLPCCLLNAEECMHSAGPWICWHLTV